jgi:hypothetical protein
VAHTTPIRGKGRLVVEIWLVPIIVAVIAGGATIVAAIITTRRKESRPPPPNHVFMYPVAPVQVSDDDDRPTIGWRVRRFISWVLIYLGIALFLIVSGIIIGVGLNREHLSDKEFDIETNIINFVIFSTGFLVRSWSVSKSDDE